MMNIVRRVRRTYPGAIVVGLVAVVLGLVASVWLYRWHWSLLIPAAVVFLVPLFQVWWSNRQGGAGKANELDQHGDSWDEAAGRFRPPGS